MREILAVCDVEKAYVTRLMEFLNRDRNLPFSVYVFTSVEELLRGARDRHLAVLLISERTYTEEVEQLDCEKIMILTEDGTETGLEKYGSVYKYQPPAAMLREVLDCYSTERIATKPSVARKHQPRRLTVFDCMDVTLRTTTAICMGQILAESDSVLYVNLSSGVGIESLLGAHWSRSLSDLLYFYRINPTGLAFRRSGIVQQLGRMDYIPPVSDPEDFRALNGEEWVTFLDELINTSSYEVLILDFGVDFPAWEQLLAYGDEIYLPTSRDRFSQSAYEELELQLEARLGTDLVARIRRIEAEIAPGGDELESFFDRQLHAGLGSAIREVLAT